MQKIFSGISKFIALIFAILFVISAVVALYLTTLGRYAFNANLYKSILLEQDIYNRSPAILGEIMTAKNGWPSDSLTAWFTVNPCPKHPGICAIDWSYSRPRLLTCVTSVLTQDGYNMVVSGTRDLFPAELQSVQNECLIPFADVSSTDSSGGQAKLPSILQVLKASDWEAIIKNLVPPAELQTVTESFIDQAFSYWNGESQDNTYWFVTLKQRFTGQAGLDAIKQAMRLQPACTPALLDEMNAGDGLTICNLSEDEFKAINPLMQTQLKSDVSHLPDGIEISSVVPTVRMFLPWTPLLPLFFLLLVTLAGVRSIKGWLRWWGILILCAGLISLGIMYELSPLLNWAWKTFIIIRLPPYFPADLANLGREIVRNIFLDNNIKGQIYQLASLLSVVGLAMWIGSYFIKNKPVEPKAVSPAS
jgi:hypothetical protein